MFVNMAEAYKCIFCFKNFSANEKATTLTQKGCDGIIKGNEFRERKIIPSVGDKVKTIRKLVSCVR